MTLCLVTGLQHIGHDILMTGDTGHDTHGQCHQVSPGQWSRSEAGGGRAIAGARTRLELGNGSVQCQDSAGGGRLGISRGKKIKVIIIDAKSVKRESFKVYVCVLKIR